MPEIDMREELYIEGLKKRQAAEPADLELVMSYLANMTARSKPMARLRSIEGLIYAYMSREEYDKAIALIDEERSELKAAK